MNLNKSQKSLNLPNFPEYQSSDDIFDQKQNRAQTVQLSQESRLSADGAKLPIDQHGELEIGTEREQKEENRISIDNF